MKLKWKILFYGSMLIFTAYFIFDLIQNFDSVTLQSIFANMDLLMYIFIILLYFLMNFVRTIKFYILYDKEVKLSTMFSIHSCHNLLSHIIPYRLGEISHLYFMKEQKIEVEKSVSVLLLITILDFIICGIIFLIISIILINKFENPEIYLISSLIISALSVGLLFFLMFTKKSLNMIKRFLIKFEGQDYFFIKIGNKICEILEKIDKIKSSSKIKKIVFYSIIVRILSFLINILIFVGLKVDLPFYVVMINELFLMFIQFIPLSFFASFGFYERTFTVLLLVQNILIVEPYNIGLAWHLILITFNIGNALVGIFVETIKRMINKKSFN